MSAIWLFFIIIIGLIFLGVSIPICFVLGAAVFCLMSGSNMNFFVSQAFYALESTSMLAIPLFTLAGILIDKTGVATVLVDLAERGLKRFKGGMGAIIPIVSAFFGALTGSGVATCTTLSTMITPRLEQKGWDRRYVAAFIAASAPLGFMIPPNMNAIVFTKVSSASVADLFAATIVPGIIWVVLFLLINRLTYHKWYKAPEVEVDQASVMADKLDKATTEFARKCIIAKELIPAILFPVIVMGGIYGGIFTATEAGGVGCAYALLVGVVVYRNFKMKDFKDSLSATFSSIGTLLVIMPMSMIFTRILIVNNVPALVAQVITGISTNRYAVLLIIDIILVIAGFFFSANVLILVLSPLLIPTCTAIGVSEIQYAVILFVCVGIGACTPPMSMLLFTSARLNNVTVPQMVKPLIPFLVFGCIPVLILVSLFPALSEWLPALLH